MPVVIAGAGNFAREVAGWLSHIKVKPSGFLDDEAPGHRRIATYQRQPDEHVLVAIADPQHRELIVGNLKQRGAVFRGLELHLASTGVTVGNGSVLCPMSLASCNAHIGDFVIINVMTSVGHDVLIGDYCTISSHVDLCGHVEIGRRVFIGSGARVMPGVKIGDDAKIGAGAVVVKDVPAVATVYGPAGKIL